MTKLAGRHCLAAPRDADSFTSLNTCTYSRLQRCPWSYRYLHHRSRRSDRIAHPPPASSTSPGVPHGHHKERPICPSYSTQGTLTAEIREPRRLVPTRTSPVVAGVSQQLLRYTKLAERFCVFRISAQRGNELNLLKHCTIE